MNRKRRWEPVPSSDGRPATRDDAEALLADRISKINRGELVKVKRITFRDFAELWMKNYALLGDIKETTLANYQGYFENHLFPAFGDRQLTAINVEDVQAFKADLLKRGNKRREKGLSAQMIKHQLRLLRQMLNHAVDWEYLRKNPAEKVDYPKVRRDEMVPLSPAEVGPFLAKVPEEWEAFFLTAITGGLRIGELIAMKWGNLNEEKRTYFVKETWVRPLNGNGWEIREPKSESSKTTVELSRDCIWALNAHKRCQEDAGLGIEDDDLGIHV